MSAGETDGLDLTVETLAFIRDNYDATADSYGRPDWGTPVLRNGVEKTIFAPSPGDVAGYTYALRNNDVITVEEAGRTNTPIGTEFDFDVEAEVDVRIEAMNNGQTVIGGSTDWRAFVDIVKRSILQEREYPVLGTGAYSWTWLTVTNESTLPDTENNRDHYGTELTISWFGYEELP